MMNCCFSSLHISYGSSFYIPLVSEKLEILYVFYVGRRAEFFLALLAIFKQQQQSSEGQQE